MEITDPDLSVGFGQKIETDDITIGWLIFVTKADGSRVDIRTFYFYDELQEAVTDYRNGVPLAVIQNKVYGSGQPSQIANTIARKRAL